MRLVRAAPTLWLPALKPCRHLRLIDRARSIARRRRVEIASSFNDRRQRPLTRRALGS
jgi:hypothetical protein